MKYLIFTLLTLFSVQLQSQTVTHHQDSRGRMWQIHTFHKPQRDSVVCYIYGKPGHFDRAKIKMTKDGELYDALYFFKAKRKRTKYWSFFPQGKEISHLESRRRYNTVFNKSKFMTALQLYIQDFSYKQIADKLGITVAEAKAEVFAQRKEALDGK